MSTQERLANLFRSVFEDERIDLDDAMTADDIPGWDSIGHISLVFAIEDEFRVRLSSEDLQGMSNVGDLRRAIEEKLP